MNATNPVIVVWIASLMGALLFFAAGAFAARRRAYAGGPVAGLGAVKRNTPVPSAAAGGVFDQPARPPVPNLDAKIAAMEAEATLLQSALATAQEQLKTREGELQRFRRALEEVQSRSGEEAGRWHSERADLEDRAARVPRLEAELEQRRQEIARWRQELREAEGQLARSPSAETEQTLKQDLAIKVQLLRANEQRLVHLEEENAKLRQDTGGAAGVREERDRLRAENAQLRAKAFAGRPASSGSSILGGGGTVPLQAPPKGAGRGHLFQTFVEQVSRMADVRCAVVADELGLVVASHGSLGDEVAAVGALLSRAGGKAIEVLPLRNVHRVTVEDDQRIILTLRPLPTREGRDSDLSLITLAVGVAPDPQALTKLINEGPRNILT